MRGKAYCWTISLLLLSVAPTALAQTYGQPDPRSSDSRSYVPPAPSAGGGEQPLATRQSSFSIPFSVGAAKSQPIEVQLYVSTDQGQNWLLYARKPPADREFMFKASQDGEYWFSPWTVYAHAAGQVPKTFQPELRVLVDTSLPQIQLDASATSAGQLSASWSVQDPNLIPDSFKLEYRSGPHQAWQPLQANPDSQSGAARASGSTTWWPEKGATSMDVRAEARDRAGNLAVASRHVLLPLADTTYPLPPPAEPAPTPGPIEELPHGTFGTPTPVPQQPNTVLPVANPNDKVASNRWTSAAGASPAAQASGPPRTGIASAPVASTARPESFAGTPARTPGQPVSSANDGPNSSYRPAYAATNPPVARRDSLRDDPLSSGESDDAVPAGERPRMTNTRGFRLTYDVESISRESITAVELWITEDGGRSWRRLLSDEDRQSPLEVEAPGEGVFGFRLVLVSANGLTSQVPQAGDLADMWVGVDTTTPQAAITAARYGQGHRAGQLEIAWTARDAFLADHPITLQFSETPSGPWTAIAAGLPNSGQYNWPVDATTPKEVYLRLEVRDIAGNIGTDQTQHPVSLAGLIPKGRIRALVPLTP